MNRKIVQVREAVAVFSFSQIHCLGLAAFLARAMREKSGFIVLDDPILSSDDDHRVHFLHEGIQTLIDAGFQIILLTQDQGVARDLGELYAHENIDCFEIEMRDPARGTEVNKTSDSLSAMLTRAKPFSAASTKTFASGRPSVSETPPNGFVRRSSLTMPEKTALLRPVSQITTAKILDSSFPKLNRTLKIRLIRAN